MEGFFLAAMIEFLLLFKSLHIIGAIAWFGGLFYIGRIFVYHVEALAKDGHTKEVLTDQFAVMERRAYYIICIPGMLITWIFGSITIATYIDTQGMEWFRINSWLHIKLLLVFLLSGYQHVCKSVLKKLSKGVVPFTSFKMRLFNEVPTIFLVAIVLIAVYRNTLNATYALTGIVIFGILLVVATRWYKSTRENTS